MPFDLCVFVVCSVLIWSKKIIAETNINKFFFMFSYIIFKAWMLCLIFHSACDCPHRQWCLLKVSQCSFCYCVLLMHLAKVDWCPVCGFIGSLLHCMHYVTVFMTVHCCFVTPALWQFLKSDILMLAVMNLKYWYDYLLFKVTSNI